MFPDLHFLLRTVVLQPLDAIFAALDLRRGRGVLLLQLLDLVAFVEQRGNSSRPSQRDDSVHHHQRERNGIAGAAADHRETQAMGKSLDQDFY